jgi:hypothetical protein
MKKTAPAAYDQRFMQELLNDLNAELAARYAKRVNIVLDPQTRIEFTSPNGTRYGLTVSNAGAAVWTPL